jgi:cytochrome c-type biogenesis protein CcmE
VELTPRRPADAGPDDDLDLDGGPGPGLAPRRPRSSGRRRWLPLVVLGLVLVLVGVFVYRGLSDATLYFRNADEAVAERDELGTDRFRLQGSVVDDPERVGDAFAFQVSYNGTVVDVEHVGSIPSDMFRAGVPVVLEGAWAEGDEAFHSDNLLVKHDEEYESQDQYDDRMREAESTGEDVAPATDAGEPAPEGG